MCPEKHLKGEMRYDFMEVFLYWMRHVFELIHKLLRQKWPPLILVDQRTFDVIFCVNESVFVGQNISEDWHYSTKASVGHRKQVIREKSIAFWYQYGKSAYLVNIQIVSHYFNILMYRKSGNGYVSSK